MIPGIVAGRAVAAAPTPESEFIALYATGAEVEFEVPSWVHAIRMHLIAPSGGAGVYSTGQKSGAGGYTVGTLPVTPGQLLRNRVGKGGKGGKAGGPGGLGGWPGGGSGSFGDTAGGGGGGYSGVFDDEGNPLGLAGGGGGGSGYSTPPGNGGGLVGGNGATSNTGGTQSSGGTGAWPGSPYQGGNADNGNRTTSTNDDGGGAGSGYYGGSAVAGDGRSAGGGSGYLAPSLVNVGSYRGTTSGLRPTEIPAAIGGISTGSYGQGVDSVASGTAPDGNDGLIVFELLAEMPADDPYELGTWSQSSTYSPEDAARREVLADFEGDPGNCSGAATGNSGEQWIKVDLGSAMPVGRVTLGGGNIPDFGMAADYVNGAEIQYSPDNSAWTAVATVSGVTDTLPLEKAFTFTPVTARYWRIRKASGYLATTTFKLAAS